MNSAANTGSSPRAPHTLRPPLHLNIVGGDLLLSGRFSHWVPLLIDGVQDAAGDAQVQILVDTTSIRSDDQRRHDTPLFSFVARRVTTLLPMLYAVEGTFLSDSAEHPVSAMVQAPHAHTPFVLVTFALPRARLPKVWGVFDSNVGRGEETTSPDEVRAQAWLRPPTVAAA